MICQRNKCSKLGVILKTTHFGGKHGGSCFGWSYGLVVVGGMVLWWKVWCCGGKYGVVVGSFMMWW